MCHVHVGLMHVLAMQFYSFDLEMTGLFLQDTREEYLDDIEDRYKVVRVAAQCCQPPHAY